MFVRNRFFCHLMNPPFFVGLPTLLTLFWLLVLWCAWIWVLGTKSSSMSRTLANRDLEDFSLRSSSFILFCIMMVFLVIFSPGLAILRIQGIHCRNNVLTYNISIINQEKFYISILSHIWHLQTQSLYQICWCAEPGDCPEFKFKLSLLEGCGRKKPCLRLQSNSIVFMEAENRRYKIFKKFYQVNLCKWDENLSWK